MVIVIMGVMGCGKSSFGQILAQQTGGRFFEGDEEHPKKNIEKMRAGIALSDEDRAPWLAAVAARANRSAEGSQPIVVSCSALKHRYREVLRREISSHLRFVWLDIPKHEIEVRVNKRVGHFMSSTLIDSQFATLEVPVIDAPLMEPPLIESPSLEPTSREDDILRVGPAILEEQLACASRWLDTQYRDIGADAENQG